MGELLLLAAAGAFPVFTPLRQLEVLAAFLGRSLNALGTARSIERGVAPEQTEPGLGCTLKGAAVTRRCALRQDVICYETVMAEARRRGLVHKDSPVLCKPNPLVRPARRRSCPPWPPAPGVPGGPSWFCL